MNRLAEILKRLKEIETEVRNGNVTPELEKELDELLEEKRKIMEKQEVLEAKFAEAKNVIIPMNHEVIPEEEDRFASKPYRRAFRDFITGKTPEMRVDATTATTDLGAVIPTTILNKIVQELEDYGEIYKRITITNFKGGLDIPLGGTKPTANWVSEGSTAEKQKFASSTKISFSYYKLQIKVAITLVADTVSLDVWESTVAQNIAEAIIVALETAIINGTGTGQPLGIVKDTGIPEAQKVEFAVADATWVGWKTKLFGKLPLAYRKSKNCVIFCNPATWDKYLDGLTDDQGQPLARTNYGISGEPELRFGGKTVILTEQLPSLDDAITAGSTVFLAYGVLSDYILNSNLQLVSRSYFDEDTDEYIQKSTLIADGKLGDKNGWVLLVTPAV